MSERRLELTHARSSLGPVLGSGFTAQVVAVVLERLRDVFEFVVRARDVERQRRARRQAIRREERVDCFAIAPGTIGGDAGLVASTRGVDRRGRLRSLCARKR
jgi:hypothetical protein